jgi:enoyl-[acyl-carrier-protein] reductase (NADH)
MTTMLDELPVGRAFEAMHLLKRAGRSQEVGNAVAFLLSDISSFITGVNLPVDGGFSAAKVINI